MTGILPIKKLKEESTLSDFMEYTILDPGFFAPYIGFHEENVRSLCRGKVDFQKLHDWYDGYTAGKWHFYNPYAVIQAIDTGIVKSYGPAASDAELLTGYLKLPYDGLWEAVVTLLAGTRLLVDTSQFQNDTTTFRSRDDVLTLLIHLGYLSYDYIETGNMEGWKEAEKEKAKEGSSYVFARLPNLELRKTFAKLLNPGIEMP